MAHNLVAAVLIWPALYAVVGIWIGFAAPPFRPAAWGSAYGAAGVALIILLSRVS